MKLIAFLKRALCVVIAIALLACSLVGCASMGKPLLMLDDCSISVNLFELYLTRAKGLLCATEYGEAAKSEEFWETWVDLYDKKTYNTLYTEKVLEDAKGYLASIAVFDELGLELPQSYIDEIDAELNEMLINEANGSKAAFNAILAHYGANYDILREAYIIEAKIEYLREELFGKNGSKVGANLIDDYYKENYARFKQVFLSTYEEVYDEDENGDRIYYRKDTSRISYDTTKTAKTKEDGSYVTDKNGDRVYVYTDDSGKERVAYKKDGAEAKKQYDSAGEPKIRHYKDSDPEMKIVESDAKAILAEAKTGDFDGFNTLVSEYSQGSNDYPNGYYVSQFSDYDAIEVIDEVFDMQVGEVRRVRSDYGVHIVMRYELEEGAYTFEENDDLFISVKTGTYIFMNDLIDKLLYEYIKEYKDRITVDEKLLTTVDIKRADINFYY